MSSFRQAKARFACQAAHARREVFGGATDDGTADADGFNLQLVAAPQTKFNAAFTTLTTDREITEHGFREACHAKIVVLRSLDIPYGLGTQYTYLPTGEVFKVAQVIDRPGFPEIPLALRRLE